MSLYEELAWAHNTLMSDPTFGNSWLWDTHSSGKSELVEVQSGRNDYDAIPSLPKAPRGFKKEDRSLENAMQSIYKTIVYNRAKYIKQLLNEDDYTFDCLATCEPLHPAPMVKIPLTESTMQEPLLFSRTVIPRSDLRPEPLPILRESLEESKVQSAGYTTQDRNQSQIRVLILLPGLPWSPLCGTLIKVSLRGVGESESATGINDTEESVDRPNVSYEALSYMWGPTTSGEHIYLSGAGQNPITDNLAKALRRLRRLNEIRVLWIDALCINQDDMTERSQQVQMMGSIYSRANRVLVWLGDCNEPKEVMLQTYLFQTDVGSAVHHGHNQLIERHPLDEEQDWRIRDLVSIFKNTKNGHWWERVWIVQEFALARYAPIVCFGCHEIPWNELQLYLDTIHTTIPAMGWDALISMYRLNDFSSNVQDIMKKRKNSTLKFHLAMYLTLRAKASNPRDQVYARLSLVRDFEAQAIEPDYTKTCSEVFVDSSASLMKASSSLELLLIVTNHNQEDRLAGLPTWAVDFTFGNRFAQIGADQNMPVALPSTTQWYTGPRLDNHLKLDVPRGVLCVEAIRLDRISGVVRLAKRTSRYPEQRFHEEVAQIHRMLEQLNTVDPYRQCFNEVEHQSKTSEASRSLGNQDWSSVADAQACGLRGCGEYPRAYTTEDILSASFSIWSQQLQRVSQATYEACRCKARGNISSWTWYCEFFSGGITVFTTLQGFIGIAPNSVRVDDIVLLPFAASTPIVVRDSDRGLVFEGLAFVHGVMEGELEKVGSPLLEATQEVQII